MNAITQTLEASAGRARFGLGLAVAVTGAGLWLVELTRMLALAGFAH